MSHVKDMSWNTHDGFMQPLWSKSELEFRRTCSNSFSVPASAGHGETCQLILQHSLEVGINGTFHALLQLLGPLLLQPAGGNGQLVSNSTKTAVFV